MGHSRRHTCPPVDGRETPQRSDSLRASDRVALGRCRPRAPTDPYVLALEHTVPQIMVSLRVRRLNERCAREPAGIAGGDAGTRSMSSNARGCGDQATSAIDVRIHGGMGEPQEAKRTRTVEATDIMYMKARSRPTSSSRSSTSIRGTSCITNCWRASTGPH